MCICIFYFMFPDFFFFFKVATFDYSSVNSASVHYLWVSQTSLFSNFLLKMDLTILFTHLKIILLRCF